MAGSQRWAAFRVDPAAVSDEILEQLYETATGSEKKITHDVVCKKCGIRDREVFSVPDTAARTKASELLLSYAAKFARGGLGDLAARAPEDLSGEERRALLAQLRDRLGGEDGEVVGEGAEGVAEELVRGPGEELPGAGQVARWERESKGVAGGERRPDVEGSGVEDRREGEPGAREEHRPREGEVTHADLG